MNIGYYFHIPMVRQGSGAAVPAHVGRFVDELARQAGKVTFYGHAHGPTGTEDFVLGEPLVTVVDLGPRRSAPYRTLFGKRMLAGIDVQAHGVDVMLVRGPSPLLPWFRRACGRVPVAYYLVGDYRTATPARSMPAWRRAAIDVWKRLYLRQQARALASTTVFVNSPELAGDFVGGGSDVHEVISSVVRGEDIVERPALRAPGRPFRVAYAGRIVEEKGLTELVAAVAQLASRGVEVAASLYGHPEEAAYTRILTERIEQLGVSSRIHWQGYVPLHDLRDRLWDADCLVLPSYHEGFPLVVLDAMASGVPVIATRVGGLPHYLNDGDDALLIEPRSAAALAGAIERLAADGDLRQRLAVNGLSWVREHTVRRTCSEILDVLRRLVTVTPSHSFEP